jgi:hypothetical protein
MKTKMTKMVLSLPEYENFRSIAERYNVKYDVKALKNDMYEIEAPTEKLLQWGYLETTD